MTDLHRGYRYKDGRRYHGYEEEAYYIPNDEAEVDRLGKVVKLLIPDVKLRPYNRFPAYDLADEYARQITRCAYHANS